MLYYTAFMRGLWWWIASPIVMLIILFVGDRALTVPIRRFALAANRAAARRSSSRRASASASTPTTRWAAIRTSSAVASGSG